MRLTAISIIEKLRANGHKAFFAGGCVRDMLLGIHPKDIDIATSARPQEVEALFAKTVSVGRDFGVVVAVEHGHHFEIATFRTDQSYTDGRRPDKIKFSNPKQDANRRDFTINAMFYDPIKEKIIDHVGGQGDLQNKLIRFIGNPEERILEDHLRLIRAIRFKNHFDMQYHPETYHAIKKHAHLVSKVSCERIRDEFNKIIVGNNADRAFEELFELGILSELIPEFTQLKGLAQPLIFHQEGDVWDHSLRALKMLTDEEKGEDPLPAKAPSLALRWAVLFHDIGKYETFAADFDRIRYNHHAEVGAEIARKIFSRLNFSSKFIAEVKWLIAHHMMVPQLMNMSVSRKRHWFLHHWFENLLEVYRADAMGIVPMDLSAYHELKKMYLHEIATLKLMPKQLLSGQDIMEIMGIAPGKVVGQILAQIREQQLAGTIKTRKQARQFVKKFV